MAAWHWLQDETWQAVAGAPPSTYAVVEHTGSNDDVCNVTLPNADLFLTVIRHADNYGGSLSVGVVGSADSGIVVSGCGDTGDESWRRLQTTTTTIDPACRDIPASDAFKQVILASASSGCLPCSTFIPIRNLNALRVSSRWTRSR